MSNYNGRRAPNVSQYLANLNQIPSQQEISPQDLSLGDDLDFLANAEFFDFDQNVQAPSFAQFAETNNHQAEVKNGPQYQFGEFQTFPGTNVTSPTSSMPSPTALHGAYPPQPSHFSPTTGDKRKASVAMQSAADLEEQSRMAAEEDKRRRNTAASARFRVKKKQREQALEKAAKDMSDKVSALEGKVQQLEMENKWLKELITDKSDVKTVEAALAKKSEKDAEGRIAGSRTDGVGTESTGAEGEA
ncbi:hypothetical protein DOTSEDRAFT_72123 [Dothistroma septosporum NZE10]|uniref:BZIP domain-containing protein n=1 Tax=Dothistroma septosporum (strain NZE10 / CBS 128990) TaxID=675120 RepID=N1PQA3_DOTSN|nr:hypothetical protein DOTSEDRAFT_72123 [Dothistroma septosporum NZE10]